MAFHFSLGLPGGFLGVDLFFAISGFVITRGLLVTAESSVSTGQALKQFYARRVWRLWPALLSMLLVIVGVALLVRPSYWEEPGVTLRNAVAAVFASGNWFQVVVEDPPNKAFRPLIHMWSLSIEEQFYLVLPLLVLLGRRHARRIATMIGAASIFTAFVAALLSPGPRWSFFATPARIGPVGAGVLVAVVLHGRRERSVPKIIGVLAGGLVAVMAIAMLLLTWEDRLLWRGGYAGLSVLYAAIVGATAVCTGTWWDRVMSIPPVQWFGTR